MDRDKAAIDVHQKQLGTLILVHLSVPLGKLFLPSTLELAGKLKELDFIADLPYIIYYPANEVTAVYLRGSDPLSTPQVGQITNTYRSLLQPIEDDRLYERRPSMTDKTIDYGLLPCPGGRVRVTLHQHQRELYTVYVTDSTRVGIITKNHKGRDGQGKVGWNGPAPGPLFATLEQCVHYNLLWYILELEIGDESRFR